ncbi:MAG: RnfABCDGE type electron transport complex subunit D [Saprospiraceae bacterium]
MMVSRLAPETFGTETDGIFKFMAVPWYYHFYMGSFFFAIAFMATSPVTAASTTTGKWIYGFFIGFIGIGYSYPEPCLLKGWMLAISLNVFAFGGSLCTGGQHEA